MTMTETTIDLSVYNHLKDLMRGKDGRKVANNSYVETTFNGGIAYRLHNTRIVTAYPDGRVIVNTNGWHTLTTKNRLNDVLRPTIGLSVWQRDYQWHIGGRGKSAKFVDDMDVSQL